MIQGYVNGFPALLQIGNPFVGEAHAALHMPNANGTQVANGQHVNQQQHVVSEEFVKEMLERNTAMMREQNATIMKDVQELVRVVALANDRVVQLMELLVKQQSKGKSHVSIVQKGKMPSGRSRREESAKAGGRDDGSNANTYPMMNTQGRLSSFGVFFRQPATVRVITDAVGCSRSTAMHTRVPPSHAARMSESIASLR